MTVFNFLPTKLRVVVLGCDLQCDVMRDKVLDQMGQGLAALCRVSVGHLAAESPIPIPVPDQLSSIKDEDLVQVRRMLHLTSLPFNTTEDEDLKRLMKILQVTSLSKMQSFGFNITFFTTKVWVHSWVMTLCYQWIHRHAFRGITFCCQPHAGELWDPCIVRVCIGRSVEGYVSYPSCCSFSSIKCVEQILILVSFKTCFTPPMPPMSVTWRVGVSLFVGLFF